MIERHELEIFLGLAEELHFTRTAERLHVSSALVSRTIKLLERRIGAPLFERTSRRVTLTPIGLRLYEDLRPAYDQMQAGLRRAVSAARGITAELSVGYMSAAAGELLLTVVDAFSRQHPGCVVRTRETTLEDFLGPLRRGETALQLLPFPVEEPDLVTGGVLLRDPATLAVPSESRLAAREEVQLDDLAGQTVLYVTGPPDYWVDSHYPSATPDGHPLDRRGDLTGMQEILTHIAAGRGTSIVGAQGPRYYARPGVTYVPLTDAPAYEYGLVWHAARQTATVTAFAELAAQVSADQCRSAHR